MSSFYDDPAQFRERRVRLKITQKQIANQTGVTQAYVSEIEKGQRPFIEPVRSRLWTALGEIELHRNKIADAKAVARKPVPLKSLLGPLTAEAPGAAAAYSAVQFLKSLGLDKTPEEQQREEIELLKAEAATRENRIKELERTVALQQELLDLQDKRDTWFKPLSDELERVKASNAELLDLLGIETQEGILHWKKEELREKIQQKSKPVPSDKAKE